MLILLSCDQRSNALSISFSACDWVPGKVLVTEPTGADTMLVAEVNGVEINCRINPGYSTPVGQVVPLMFDMSKVVFFDPTTEERIDRA
jgi:multiple sugar transport system ATP-binding protein